MEQMRWRHLLPPPHPPLSHPCSFSPPPPIFPVAFLLFYPASLQFSPSPRLNFFVIFSTLGTLSSLISPSIPSITCSLSLYPVLFQPLTRLFSLFLPFFLLQGTQGSLSALLPTAHTHDQTWRQTHLPRVR